MGINKQPRPTGKPGDGMQVPGMCMVVIVVVVMRVVVVSSSMGSEDMIFLDLGWLAAEEELKAVVSSPGDMTVAVDSACLSPGTACVGLVVVPAEVQLKMYHEQSYFSCST